MPNRIAKPARARSAAATIYDIAKLAGVNPSTVSRALTTPGRISAKTEAKIRAAAKELNYVVNPFARALPTGRTKMIALMIADITNPVFFNVIRGAESVAAENGYVLVVAESQEQIAEEPKILKRILPTVDAVMLITTRLPDEAIQKINESKPTVLVNQICQGVSDVVPNYAPGVIESVAHLKSLGHENVAFLSGPSTSWMSRHRWNLLMTAAVDAGMKIVEIGPNSPDLRGGSESVDRVIASGVTAVVCYNDLMAIGLVREMQKRGHEVPQDLSVIGFDNIFGSDITSPGITTVQLQLEQLGKDALAVLLKLLGKENQDGSIKESSLESSLLVRGSTGVARAKA